MSILIGGGVLVVLFLGGVVLFFLLDYGLEQPRERGAAVQTVAIPRGVGSGKIGELLEERGIIRHRYLWYYYLWRQGVSHKLQAGEYELSAAMTIPEVAEKMIKGEAVSREKKVTIPEGFTSEEIQARLKEAGFAFDLKKEMAALGIAEGYLFPDTYFLDDKATGAQVIKKMHENFLAKIKALESALGASGRTLEEIVIMASLIEEEIPHPQDRPIAAGVLWKRLEAGMALQVDAAVIYAKGIRGGTGRERALTRRDLEIDSLYNTYKYQGLPPGAIANPGLDAIRAALTPQASEYWYYLSKPDGTTVFSRTFDEHNGAKVKYLQ